MRADSEEVLVESFESIAESFKEIAKAVSAFVKNEEKPEQQKEKELADTLKACRNCVNTRISVNDRYCGQCGYPAQWFGNG
jgi:phosphoglycerate-specific signal transduction histidine kinase